jgi:hypothetical protein
MKKLLIPVLIIIIALLIWLGYDLFHKNNNQGSGKGNPPNPPNPPDSGLRAGWTADIIQSVTQKVAQSLSSANCGVPAADAANCFVSAVSHAYSYDDFTKMTQSAAGLELLAIEAKCCQGNTPVPPNTGGCSISSSWDDQAKACLLKEALTSPLFPTTCNDSMVDTTVATQLRDYVVQNGGISPKDWFSTDWKGDHGGLDPEKFDKVVDAVHNLCGSPVTGKISWTDDQKNRLKIQLTMNYNTWQEGALFGLCDGCDIDSVVDQIAKTISPNQWETFEYFSDNHKPGPTPLINTSLGTFCGDKTKCCKDKTKCVSQL